MQTKHKLNTQPNTQLNTSTSSSGGKYIYKTTTTGEIENSEKWKLDIEPLSKIGFTKIHLEQIHSQKKLEPNVVQDSIYAFAFDLDENKKAETIKGQPLNFFMGILRNGKPYAPPANYESPSDKAMRLYLEGKERIKKQREEIEERSCALAFDEWFTNLSNDEKKKYNLMGTKFNPESDIVRSIAYDAFKKEFWQNIKQKIIAKEVG